VARIITILSRFGVSSKKFEYLLRRYHTVTSKLNLTPTFAITAVVLERHPKQIRELSQRGVEFAVHGYVHIDYKTTSQDGQIEHFKKAMGTFKIHEIPFVGFRAPFLRVSGYMTKTLKQLDFAYDSSRTIHWNVIDFSQYSRYVESEYNRLLEFYQPQQAEEYMALPRIENGLIQIPVSIPDDEMIMERLGIRDAREISKIWRSILEATYNRGELFNIQLHPERIIYFENALADIMHQVNRYKLPVWVATLKEIAEWWKERSYFTLCKSTLYQ
jgi:peptidoglycan/xylan/chitin deacetylase (PgdA/CDA1 family)